MSVKCNAEDKVFIAVQCTAEDLVYTCSMYCRSSVLPVQSTADLVYVPVQCTAEDLEV